MQQVNSIFLLSYPTLNLTPTLPYLYKRLRLLRRKIESCPWLHMCEFGWWVSLHSHANLLQLAAYLSYSFSLSLTLTLILTPTLTLILILSLTLTLIALNLSLALALALTLTLIIHMHHPPLYIKFNNGMVFNRYHHWWPRLAWAVSVYEWFVRSSSGSRDLPRYKLRQG